MNVRLSTIRAERTVRSWLGAALRANFGGHFTVGDLRAGFLTTPGNGLLSRNSLSIVAFIGSFLVCRGTSLWALKDTKDEDDLPIWPQLGAIPSLEQARNHT